MTELFIVGTPIGNLEDITIRAIEVLKKVNYILSEDTRETSKVLQKFQIETPQFSYRDQNHERILPSILALLEEGKSLALVSDSGTPLISDPGFKLVRAVMNAGYKVTAIPGASAITAALSVCGLPTDKVIFLGFLPRKDNQIKSILEQYGNLDCTLTIYESPYRVGRLLEHVKEVLGDRTVCLAKDLTKLYEDVQTKKVSQFLQEKEKIVQKGEYVVLVAKEGF